MDFRVDTDIWFVFCVLFIAALALCIFLYIKIPLMQRKKQVERIKSRQQRTNELYSQLEQKKTEQQLSTQEETIDKLKIEISDHLHQIAQPGTYNPNLASFYASFEKIYPNFSQSLKALCPNISGNELKLCALLRLNLSSKEIGQLLNITQDSVNKARYRLRKKLGLTSKEDIFTILLTLKE